MSPKVDFEWIDPDNLGLLKLLIQRFFDDSRKINEFIYYSGYLNITIFIPILIYALIYLPLDKVLISVSKGIFDWSFTYILVVALSLFIYTKWSVFTKCSSLNLKLKQLIYFTFSTVVYFIITQISNVLGESNQVFVSTGIQALSIIGLTLSITKLLRQILTIE